MKFLNKRVTSGAIEDEGEMGRQSKSAARHGQVDAIYEEGEQK